MRRLIGAALVAALTTAACSGSDGDAAPEQAAADPAPTDAVTTTEAAVETTTAGPAADAAPGSGDAAAAPAAATAPPEQFDLRGLCPDPVVVQTDWNPESEHGGLYELVGDGYVVDAAAKSVTGPLVAGDVETGVRVEIRAGGPAIGFQSVPVTMYQRPEIMFGYVSSDDAVEFSVVAPTVGVVAPLERNPMMVMWDPATYPDAETIADLGELGVPIRYFEGEPYMAYLGATGVVDIDLMGASYNGAPLVFVEENGRIAQQGFASAEPYQYEHDIGDWGRPVRYQLIDDTGWRPYPDTMAVRPEVIEALPECFEKLVPIMQQAQVDYIRDPAGTDGLILDLVPQYDTGWTYSTELADFAVATMLADGIVSNGGDATLGDFDLDRMTEFIDFAVPVLSAAGKAVKPGLTAADLVTNEFIDPSIGL